MSVHTSTTWVCSVAVATVWTTPESVRDIDQPGIENPVQINKWIEALTNKELLDLCDENRVQTQLLFGEPVTVEEVVGDWAKVNCTWQSTKKHEQGYPGWVPLLQLKEIPRISDFGYAKVRIPKVQLWTLDRKPKLVVPFNTILPVIDNNSSFTLVHTALGDLLVSSKDVEISPGIEAFVERDSSEMVSSASQFLELPYFWGGMSSYGFDCSGLTYNMFKAHGYFIPRDADDQAKHGEEVNLRMKETWEVGDLLFFATIGKETVRHVGIYYGNHQMIHSPSTGKSVEIIELAGTKYVDELVAVRRYARKKGDA
ncbi:MAG: NlpC/P60 family protein [Paenisporosarcina sp.]|nr:NlpC/P60 family protein [Paenisporosarcina sp.]